MEWKWKDPDSIFCDPGMVADDLFNPQTLPITSFYFLKLIWVLITCNSNY